MVEAVDIRHPVQMVVRVVEPVEIEDAKKIKTYLPAWKPTEILDIRKPLTLGAFVTPQYYMEIRQELHDDIVASKKLLAKEMVNFKKIFGRKLSLAPGKEATVTFVLAWHFPNLSIKNSFTDCGRYYATKFFSAQALSRFKHFSRLCRFLPSFSQS